MIKVKIVVKGENALTSVDSDKFNSTEIGILITELEKIKLEFLDKSSELDEYFYEKKPKDNKDDE